MALSEEVRTLRDHVLADLNSVHDYYTDTKYAWRLVHLIIASGRTFTFRNRITGTITTQAELTTKSRGYLAEQLAEATFQQCISTFESFFFELLRLWIIAYPQRLGGRQVDFKSVLGLPDKDAITQLVVAKEVSEILYDRPAGWFKYLKDKLGLDCTSADEIDRIAEAKASRDVLVHNRGFANKVYVSKAGSLARFKDGDKIDIPEHYHRETWELIRKVVSDVSNAAIAKSS